MSGLHPIKKFCASQKPKKMTYRQFAAIVRDANDSLAFPSAQIIAHYVAGTKRPSPKAADMIHRAFPKISRESLLYYRNRDAA